MHSIVHISKVNHQTIHTEQQGEKKIQSNKVKTTSQLHSSNQNLLCLYIHVIQKKKKKKTVKENKKRIHLQV